MAGRVSRVILAAASLALLSGTALAGGFSIREQSAEGQGASFAGVAAGTDGLSAMFWNPATISQHNSQGYISESDVALILPYSKGTAAGVPPALANSGNIGVTAFVPASYSTYGLTEDITLGLAITSPFGLATDSDTWMGSPHGNKSKIQSININPNIAYKPVDGITIGLGLQGQWMKGSFTSQSPLGGPNFLSSNADDFGFGVTAGVLLEPTDDLDIGIGFRSAVKHKLKGDGRFAPIGYAGDMSAAVTTPETVTFGAKYQATENLKLMAGVEWSNWSRLKDLTIKLDQLGGLPLTTKENWKDSWFFSLGTEYALTDQLTLRGGLAYEKSPVADATRTPRLPDNDRYWVSVGAGYKVNDWFTANLAYSHVFMKDGGVALAGGGGLPPLKANFKQHLDIVSASAVIDW